MRHIITIVRYIALMGVVLETYAVLVSQTSIERWLIVLFIYAINFQLRYFQLNRANLRFISLLFDVIFMVILYVRVDLFSIFAVSIYIFDIFYLCSKKQAFFLQGIFSVLFFVIASLYGLLFGIGDVLSVLFLSLLCFSYSSQTQKSRRVEENNYQLMQQVNELEKNKEVMEQYMGSMRELYTLRERNRISRELHDSVGHSLSTIIIQLGAISSIAKKSNPQIAEMSDALRAFSTRSMQQVREQLSEMKPEQFNRNQLFVAIDEMLVDYQENTRIRVNFGISEQKWHLSERQELLLYRVIQEFLSNSAKYAEATRINIFLHFNEEHLILTLKDNGRGAEKIVPHLGLLSIKERVAEVKGELKINTSPGNGFQMQVMISKEGDKIVG